MIRKGPGDLPGPSSTLEVNMTQASYHVRRNRRRKTRRREREARQRQHDFRKHGERYWTREPKDTRRDYPRWQSWELEEQLHIPEEELLD